MKFRLWLTALIVLMFCGTYALTHMGEDIRMQTVDGYVADEDKGEGNGSFLSEIGSDFRDMLAIGKDFLRVLSGGESDYNSGVAVLLGDEEIEKDNRHQEPDAKEHSLGIPNVTVADAVQQKNAMEVEEISGTIPLVRVEVVSVIDGDTFLAELGETQLKVRLIGVDTPESVHSDTSRNTVYGEYASDYTKNILQNNMTVYLEYDEEPTDIYGRTLAYVWLSEDSSDPLNMLNAILVKDGYAYDKVYKPNDKYAALFEELCTNAQNTGAGLWADEGFAALWEG